MGRRLWTREEEIIVFNLYCKIPFQRASKNHPDVIRVAELIGRTPSAVNMKIGNFGSFDATLRARGIVGLTNASKLDAQIWAEFNDHWDELSFESERLLAELQGTRFDMPAGYEQLAVARRRVNQNFFRQAVLSAYRNSCCITGLNMSALLIASHIKPWAVGDASERTNPANGLCLNALHDKAFDSGLITVTPDYKIHVATDIAEACGDSAGEKFFTAYDRRSITLPEKFAPLKKFLEYHNDVVFRHWR